MVYCPEVIFPNNKLAQWILQWGRTLTYRACVKPERRSAEKKAREKKERAIMVGCCVTCICAANEGGMVSFICARPNWKLRLQFGHRS
jgi:hypothetical protein